MTNMPEGRINVHKGRDRHRKAYVEEMIRQDGRCKYLGHEKTGLQTENNGGSDLQRQDQGFGRDDDILFWLPR